MSHRSRREWTEEERRAHYRAIGEARREIHAHLGPMQDDVLRRYFDTDASETEVARRAVALLLLLATLEHDHRLRALASLRARGKRGLAAAPQQNMLPTAELATTATGCTVLLRPGDAFSWLVIAVPDDGSEPWLPPVFTAQSGEFQLRSFHKREARVDLRDLTSGTVLVLVSDGSFQLNGARSVDELLAAIEAGAEHLAVLELEVGEPRADDEH